MLEKLTLDIMQGHSITKEQALALIDIPIKDLCLAANALRLHYCDNQFDICSIINAKSGHCSEDCKFCAQSSFYQSSSEHYSFLNKENILAQAHKAAKAGIMRFSLVTAGRKLQGQDFEKALDVLQDLQNIPTPYNKPLQICASFGLHNYEEFLALKKAGLSRVHNNVESSAQFFQNICTTHSHADKVQSLLDARRAGLELCSGGIFGLGESMEDRIDMAFQLKELNILSIPINILHPIAGTPFAENNALSLEEVLRIVAIYRFIHPKAFLRLAGGRQKIEHKGKDVFLSGANALISGDMLTIAGNAIEEDIAMIKDYDFQLRACL